MTSEADIKKASDAARDACFAVMQVFRDRKLDNEMILSCLQLVGIMLNGIVRGIDPDTCAAMDPQSDQLMQEIAAKTFATLRKPSRT